MVIYKEVETSFKGTLEKLRSAWADDSLRQWSACQFVPGKFNPTASEPFEQHSGEDVLPSSVVWPFFISSPDSSLTPFLQFWVKPFLLHPGVCHTMHASPRNWNKSISFMFDFVFASCVKLYKVVNSTVCFYSSLCKRKSEDEEGENKGKCLLSLHIFISESCQNAKETQSVKQGHPLCLVV